MNDFLNRYRNNQCTEDDLNSTVNLFLSEDKKNALDVEMKNHWDEVTDEGETPDLKATLYKIHYQIGKNENIPTTKLNWGQYFSRVAAVLIIPITIAFGYLFLKDFSVETQMQTITSPLASRTSFDLPDGSKVWLNAGSSISFPSKFTGKNRAVQLKGQAFFDVQKAKIPFIVETKLLMVNVLGTAFDVSAYPDEEISVTLVRGKVAIKTQTNGSAVLTPGQQASLNPETGKVQKREVNPELFTSWKDNVLVFDKEPLVQVVTKLERWYNIKISIADESIKNIPVTGTFQYESINEILQLMEITNSIKYEFNKNERTIILKHK